jgi:hypothetical protein
MSSLSRYVATPPGTVRRAAKPSEKIYSFLLKDLAEASADKRSHGQLIAYSGARWVTGYKLLLGRKINPRSHTKRVEDRGSKIEDNLVTARGGPLSSIIRRRSSSGAFVDVS